MGPDHYSTTKEGGYWGGGSGGTIGVVIAIIVIIIIIFIIIWFFRNGDDHHDKGKHRGHDDYDKDYKHGYDHQGNGMNGNGMNGNGMNGNGMNGNGMNGNGGLSPSCNLNEICRQAFRVGEQGARQVLNSTLDFLEKNPKDLRPLNDISNDYGGYPIVIQPSDNINDAVLLYHIDPKIVGTPIGQLGSAEIINATAAILNAVQQGHQVVCYQWQGRTKLDLVSKSRDGRLVVATGFHLDPTQ